MCVGVCNIIITITHGAGLLVVGAAIKSSAALSVVMVAWYEMRLGDGVGDSVCE